MAQELFQMPKKIAKGFTLIELLVVLAIISILSGAGVVVYNDYTSTAKETATKANHTKIVNSMESEFVKCKLDKNSKIFNSHNCNSSNRPSTGTINNYVNNNLGLKNPYNNKQAVAQSNICTSGSISITEKEIGAYNVAYASIKKRKKHTSLVSSGWSSNYSNTKTTSVSYTCATTASTSASNKTKQTIYNYKPPNNGPGAGIIVDENGNMVPNSGAHACGADCFKTNSKGMKNWYTFINGKKVYPNRSGSKYRFVMVEAPSTSGNIASSCNGNNCKYNFSNNTYTVLNSGVTYKAGESIANRKPIP